MLILGFTFVMFTMGTYAAMLYTKKPHIKLYLTLPALLLTMSTFYFGMEFLKVTNPTATGLIKVTETFFLSTIILIAPAIIILFVITVWFLIQKFIHRERDKREEEWENW